MSPLGSFVLALLAAAVPYRIAPGEPGLGFQLHYSFGTHDGKALRASGELRIDPDAPERMSGALRVPIEAIQGDGGERDCHMRESLGLDYAKSRFPKEHLCAGNKLPAEQLAFPEIVLEIKGAKAPALETLAVDKGTKITVDAVWTIHGVSRPAQLQLLVARDAKTPGAVRVRGSAPIVLQEFGIVVKSAQVLFVTSSVDDAALVTIDVRLEPAR